MGIDDQAEFSETTYRGKIRFDPKIFNGSTNALTLSHSENNAGDDNFDATDPGARLHFGNIQGSRELDQSVAALESNVQLNDLRTLKNILTWNRSKTYNLLDLLRLIGLV